MKKTLFLRLFFILLALPAWAQEAQKAPAAQELIKLTLKVDCSEDEKYIGTGCRGGLEEAAKTFSILKAMPSPSGGIVPGSLYLEKHQWEEEDKFRISTYPAAKNGTHYIISYPYGEKGGVLTITYRVGAFDPETKTQDLTVESIRGLASLREEGEETKKTLSFNWKIKQNEDGSLELWETTPQEFKLANLEMGIGAWWGGRQSGATYLERQGEKEMEAKDGTKKKLFIQKRDIVLKAKNEKSFPCKYNPFSQIENLGDFAHSVTSSIGGLL